MTEGEKTQTENMVRSPISWKKLIPIIFIFLIIILAIGTKVIIPNIEYNKAVALYESGSYIEAVEAFKSLGDYKDSEEMLLAAKYGSAKSYFDEKEYYLAISELKELGSYKDSEEMLNESIYLRAKELSHLRKWEEATKLLEEIKDYNDSNDLIQYNIYKFAEEKAYFSKWEEALELVNTIPDYKDSQRLIIKCKYFLALEKADNKDWIAASNLMKEAKNYLNSEVLAKKYVYNFAMEKIDIEDWNSAIETLSTITDYGNSNNLIRQHKVNMALNIPYKALALGTIKEEPTEVEDFEKILLNMAINKEYKYEVIYKERLDDDTIDTIFNNLDIADLNVWGKYPEYYSLFNYLDYYSSYSSGNTIIRLMLTDTRFSIEEAEKMISDFEEEAYNIIDKLIEEGKITGDMTEKEKARVLYIWMAHNLKYDVKLSNEGYTGYGAAVNRLASCNGYTSLYNMLCKIVGIEVQGVIGSAGGESHIWTLANLDGEKVYIDSTWGDPVPDTKNYCDMTYFAVTEKFLRKTHKW